MNPILKNAGYSVAAVALAGAGYWIGRSGVEPVVPAISESTAMASGAVVDHEARETKTTVVLNPEKLQAAGLQNDIAQQRPMNFVRMVPARLQYDDTRHIALKVVTDGMLIKVFVKPGDTVVAGQPLAELSSPEVGDARANLLQKLAEKNIADRKQKWAQTIRENMTRLIAAVRERQPVEMVEKAFQTVVLGTHRETLMAAYSRYALAESLVTSIQTVAESGGLATRTVRERQSERQASRAALDGLCEQVSFQMDLDCSQADVAAEDAERRVRISRQALHALIGQFAEHDMRKQDSNVSLGMSDSDGDEINDLSLTTVRAPFAGTIENRRFSAAERVKQGDELFILADTATLWVTADIREKDWRPLALKPGQEVAVTIPAMPGEKYQGRVHYVGREVSPETNAAPLVAVVDNKDGLLRPGLFAHVELPLTEERRVLAVPAEAVVEHQGLKFVFVASGPDTFHRVDVQAGASDRDWIEIQKGLKGGEKVITHGAFLLKSELLLEAEE